MNDQEHFDRAVEMRAVWRNYYETSNEADDELQAKLYEEWPEIEQAIRLGDGPPLRLLCPRGHRLLTVELHAADWSLYLHPAREERYEAGTQVAWAADPMREGPHVDGLDEVAAPKVRFVCPKTKCNYTGEHRRERLLKLYALALRLNLTEIRLPS